MKNHTDVLIFHTGICDVPAQIPLMADEKSYTRISRRLVAQALRHGDSYEQRQARSAEKRDSAALRMARAELL